MLLPKMRMLPSGSHSPGKLRLNSADAQPSHYQTQWRAPLLLRHRVVAPQERICRAKNRAHTELTTRWDRLGFLVPLSIHAFICFQGGTLTISTCCDIPPLYLSNRSIYCNYTHPPTVKNLPCKLKKIQTMLTFRTHQPSSLPHAAQAWWPPAHHHAPACWLL